MKMQIETFQIEYRDFKIPNSDWETLESDFDNLVRADQEARAFAEENPDIVVRLIGSVQDYVIGYKFKYEDQSLYKSDGLTGWQPYGY